MNEPDSNTEAHMQIRIIQLGLILCLISTTIIAAQERVPEKFAALKPFLNKTWRGEFSNSTPEKPVIDVARWELALNGQAVRIVHSINDGEYGGESIIIWDKEKESLVYYYFTTGGFYTTGTIAFKNNQMISHEFVKGNQQGITEVKSITTMLPDGRMKGSSRYLKEGKWIKGHEAIYSEAPAAEVKFK